MANTPTNVVLQLQQALLCSYISSTRWYTSNWHHCSHLPWINGGQERELSWTVKN